MRLCDGQHCVCNKINRRERHRVRSLHCYCRFLSVCIAIHSIETFNLFGNPRDSLRARVKSMYRRTMTYFKARGCTWDGHYGGHSSGESLHLFGEKLRKIKINTNQLRLSMLSMVFPNAVFPNTLMFYISALPFIM